MVRVALANGWSNQLQIKAEEVEMLERFFDPSQLSQNFQNETSRTFDDMAQHGPEHTYNGTTRNCDDLQQHSHNNIVNNGTLQEFNDLQQHGQTNNIVNNTTIRYATGRTLSYFDDKIPAGWTRLKSQPRFGNARLK